MPRLENWTQVGDSIIGIVFDDERFSDGDVIRTTPLQSLDLSKNEARTQNTVYNLGRPYDNASVTPELNNDTVCIKNEKGNENVQS